MFNMTDLQFILPEMILLGFALIALIAGPFAPSRNMGGALALFGIAAAVFFMPASVKAGSFFFSGMLINDNFSLFFRVIILAIAALVTLISMGYQEVDKEDRSEYYFFLLIVTISMMLGVASNNLMMVYIAIEAISITSYIMAGYLKRDVYSSEAGVKYFLFGAMSTGIMLYGVSLIYGLFGTLDLGLIFDYLRLGNANPAVLPAVLLASILVLVGIGFKCSLVPFHMWTPDVYEGAPTPVSALFSVGPKAVGFALLLRIFVLNFAAGSTPVLDWASWAGVTAVLTMTIGNIMAVGQTNIKRLLAYSTIAQAGYILVGLAVSTAAGIQATLFYLFVYSIMNLGAFGAVIVVFNSIKSDNLADYAGFYKKDPFTAVALTISLLALAGIPPLAGFLAKFFILAAAVEAGFVMLAIVVVLNSVVAFYYYIKIVKYMFLVEPAAGTAGASEAVKSPALQIALLITLIGNIIFGIWPHPILNWLTSLLQVS